LYFVDSIDRDSLTLTTIAFAVVAAATTRRTAPRALAAGIVLYLLYVMSIGGDFMAGPFFSVPVVASVLLLTRLMTGPRALWLPVTAVLALVGCTATHVPLWSNSHFADADPKPNGVIDERAVYFHDKSLVIAKRATFRDPEWPRAGTLPQRMNVLPTCGLMGSSGLDFGPYAYLLDECALADPLLARLPAVFNTEWRTGHYRRMIPPGYRDSVEKSDNELQDPSLHEYYDHLRLIIRSDRLWSVARLETIVAMNLGGTTT
jgi:arabinofuranosyltransferase